MRRRIFHTPEGVRDVYNGECEEKRYLSDKLHQVQLSFGYRDIETPTIEYFDVFSRKVGTTPSRELYKFFDRDGDTLVLRPDFTPSIARASAMYFTGDDFPLRLCYAGSAFVNNVSYRGRLKESTQTGVELIGDGSVDADAEVIALLVQMLKSSGLEQFQVSVGEVDFFKSLLEEAHINEETAEELRSRISEKNHFGVQELLDTLKLPEKLKEAFVSLPRLFGSVEVLAAARDLTDNKEAQGALDRLQQLYEACESYGCSSYLSFDLGMLSKYKYYTGIIFQAYTYGIGAPVVNGGRYDHLLGHFGGNAPAVGFVLVVELLQNALHRQGIEIPSKRKRAVLFYREKERDAAVRFAMQYRENRGSLELCRYVGHAEEQPAQYAEAHGYDRLLWMLSDGSAKVFEASTGNVKEESAS